MIILPDRNIPRAKFLMPVRASEWRTPSRAQKKDHIGNESHTCFRVRAKLDDGYVVWTGWFYDRDDFDAFLWAIATGSLRYERDLWRLPTPVWHPDMGESLSYEFATLNYLNSAGSLLTYNRPSDWNNASNYIQAWGGGAGAGRDKSSGAGGVPQGGGGGGAYSINFNLSLSAPTSYQVGLGGTGATSNITRGGTGGNTWFAGTSLASAFVSAQGGQSAAQGSRAGGIGGAAASGIGSGKNNGGNGGAGQSGTNGAGGGGGGAAGANGVGITGTVGSGGSGGNGGNGDGNLGGAGATSNGGIGGNGTEAGSGFGSGGGGGGGAGSPTAGGNGGFYGAGGGGGGNSSSSAANGGAGTQGFILVIYDPYIPLSGGNMPMLGM